VRVLGDEVAGRRIVRLGHDLGEARPGANDLPADVRRDDRDVFGLLGDPVIDGGAVRLLPDLGKDRLVTGRPDGFA